MLACARIGAITPWCSRLSEDRCRAHHRLQVEARRHADEGYAAQDQACKHNTDEALTKSLGDEKVVVIKRTGGQCAMHAAGDFLVR